MDHAPTLAYAENAGGTDGEVTEGADRTLDAVLTPTATRRALRAAELGRCSRGRAEAIGVALLEFGGGLQLHKLNS